MAICVNSRCFLPTWHPIVDCGKNSILERSAFGFVVIGWEKLSPYLLPVYKSEVFKNFWVTLKSPVVPGFWCRKPLNDLWLTNMVLSASPPLRFMSLSAVRLSAIWLLLLPHAFGISINLENSSDWFPVLPDAIECDGLYKLVTWYITGHIHVNNL